MYKKGNLRKILSLGALRTLVDSRTSLLIIEVKISFSLGFDNTDYQINKLQNVHALHCTLVLYIVPEGPEFSQLEDIKGRGPHRKVKW